MEQIQDKIVNDNNAEEVMQKSIEMMQNQLNIMSELLRTKTNRKLSDDITRIVNDNQKLAEKYMRMSKADLVCMLNKQIVNEQNNKIKMDVEKQVMMQKQKLVNHIQESQDQKMEIFKIVLTGGPCAGKTTAITTLADKLRENGFVVYIIPEAASMIFQSGGDIRVDLFKDDVKVRFQYFLLMLQMSLEDVFQGISTTEGGNKIVLLCDRGSMDGSAYIEKKIWNTILTEYNLSEYQIRDERYDLVIHLSTAADGAQKFYTLANNQARSEGIQLALDIDKKLQDAWMNHPNFVQINNDYESFNDKITQVIKTVFKFVGLPATVTFYKKLIIKNSQGKLIEDLLKEIDSKMYHFKISDVIFFKGENELTYYRKRQSENQRNFLRCEKSNFQGVFKEKRRHITYREYASVKSLYSTNKYCIKKIRNCFMYKKNFFIIDTFDVYGTKLSVCVVQGYNKKVQVEMPEAISKRLIKEVPDNVVDVFSELIAKDSNKTKKIFTNELLEELRN